MRLVAVLLFGLTVLAEEPVDPGIVDRIKMEAFDRSEVMDHLYYLAEVHGPRLTGSPEFEDAANWASERLKHYGVQNVHLEHWGPFGRSWSLQQSSLELIQPRYQALAAAPLAWSAPTDGPVTGELIIAPWKPTYRDGPKKFDEDFAAYKAKWTGKLRGKIVLLNEPKKSHQETEPQLLRLTDDQLSNLAKAPAPSVKPKENTLDDLKWPDDPEDLSKFVNSFSNSLTLQFYDFYDRIIAERARFFAREGVEGVLLADERSRNGILFAENAGSFKSTDPLSPATFVVAAEQYDRIARMVEKKSGAQIRMSVKAKVSDKDVDGLNIIGEIPGGDKKDEVVMIGAHFDSWQSGTGATDNGVGSAVMIEVMRILKVLNLKLDRTVRIGLWSGEEQGLFGSRAYVKEHFADPKTMRTTVDHAKFSGYLNLDNGGGKIRGIYLQGNEAMRTIAEAWLAPFRDMGASTVSIRDTSGTDHLSFDAVGLPGFQFIQDPLDYDTVTHHSDLDTYDHAVPEDLMQASAVIATAVYEVANRKALLPRRALPKPQ